MYFCIGFIRVIRIHVAVSIDSVSCAWPFRAQEGLHKSSRTRVCVQEKCTRALERVPLKRDAQESCTNQRVVNVMILMRTAVNPTLGFQYDCDRIRDDYHHHAHLHDVEPFLAICWNLHFDQGPSWVSDAGRWLTPVRQLYITVPIPDASQPRPKPTMQKHMKTLKHYITSSKFVFPRSNQW